MLRKSSKIMDEKVEYSIKTLEKCSYRGLQQLAKSLQLPCNVKKIYLIQLIHAKKHCSRADVDNIVQRVKMERQLACQANKKKGGKKMGVQNTEVSSTNVYLSPPVSSTPSSHGLIICTPFKNTYPKQQVTRVYTTQNKSDRVLRSFNPNYKRPSYSFLNDFDDTGVRVVKVSKKKLHFESVASQDEKYKLGLATKCIVTKLRPSLTGGVSCLMQGRQIVPVSAREVCRNLANHRPQSSSDNFEIAQSFDFRRIDGKISKINAMVQKNTKTRHPKIIKTNDSNSNVEVTIQDIINSNIAQTLTDTNISEYGFSESTDVNSNIAQTLTNTNTSEYEFPTSTDINSNIAQTFKNSNISEYEFPKSMDNYSNIAQTLTNTNISEHGFPTSTDVNSNIAQIFTNTNIPEYGFPRSTDVNFNIAQTFTNTNVSEYEFPKSTDIYANIAQTFTNTNISKYEFSESTVTAPYLHTPNVTEFSCPMEIESTVIQNDTTEKENYPEKSFAVYYHNPIRAEQVKSRMQTGCVSEREARLPNIGEVFTRFQNIYSKHVTQPLYVQVSENSEMTIPVCSTAATGHKVSLEYLFNFKPAATLMYAPPLPIKRATHKQCTLSSPPVYVTACSSITFVLTASVKKPSPIVTEEMAPAASYEQDKPFQYQYLSTNDESSRKGYHADQGIMTRNHYEAPTMSTATVTSPQNQDLEASADEMVEDALEIISQDGDYMERVIMDVRMQCILCQWAGSMIVLDLHVEKEHANDIVKQDRSDWNTTYRLGSLADQPLWLSEVRELDGRRYALSVKRESDWLLVSLSTLTIDPKPKNGSITIYNKITGQPYTWEGPIQLIPTNMPYENDGEYLKVAVDELDLVPRNPELRGTNKVVGRCNMNDVFVIVFVQIM